VFGAYRKRFRFSFVCIVGLRVDFKSFYNVTSLVHSYIVITVFLGLVSGLLLVHSGAF